ncbi:MAG: hypothetical protein J7K00_04780 [Candidatus Diapherotrites archaeon]|nr:hypothetical protein [Candidatus Diapherotrites archaeon]
MKAKAVLLDVDYAKGNAGNSIRLSLKTKDGYLMLFDESFSDYFYVLAEPDCDAKKLVSEIEKVCVEVKKRKDHKERENHSNRGYTQKSTVPPKPAVQAKSAAQAKPVVLEIKKINGKETECIKINVGHTSNLKPVRDIVKKMDGVADTREHMIKWTLKYLIDKGVSPLQSVEVEFEKDRLKSIRPLKDQAGQIKVILKKMAFDLEVKNPFGVPRPSKDEIVMVSVWNNEKKVLSYSKDLEGTDFVENFGNEEKMLEGFSDTVKKIDPDIIIGYNTDNFDFPYLRERSRALKNKLLIGRDNSEVRFVSRKDSSQALLTGRQVIDVYRMVQFLARTGSLDLMRYRLEDVFEAVFNEKKEKIDTRNIDMWWSGGKDAVNKLAQYCLEDSKAVFELFDNFSPQFEELARLLSVSLQEVTNLTSGQMVEQFLVREAKKRGELIPRKPSFRQVMGRARSTYKGGMVKQPTAGLHESIMVFDFRSLYPSIIISHNIDSSTLDCDCCSDDESFVSPGGHKFCAKKKGFIPEILEEILLRRKQAKQEMKKQARDSTQRKILDAKQHALKIIANSAYGVMGYPRFRWYSLECAESTAAWGRQYIQKTIAEAEKFGLDVLYADTDSVFVTYGKGDVRKKGMEFMRHINENVLPEKMELDFQGFYKRGLFVTKREGKEAAKKRYALLGEDGKVEIKGFEFVRRDWAEIAKNTQQKVIGLVLEGKPKEAADYVKSVVERLRKGEVSKKELVIYTRLKKKVSEYESIGPHVAAVEKARARGEEVADGALVGYIVTKHGKTISAKAEVMSFAREGDFDAEYYVNNQVLPATMRIIGELGFKDSDMTTEGKQSSMKKWF